MTDAGEPKRTNLPVAGARLEARGHHVSALFYPLIRLDRKSGFEFAATLSDYIDPAKAELGAEQWVFSQPLGGSPQSQLRVVIRPDGIHVGADFPPYGQEWFENRAVSVLRKFGDTFAPEFLRGSKAMIRGVLPIDGDAREYLAAHVMKIDQKRADPLGRPIHLIGLRLFFPPFVKEAEGKQERTEWGVNLRAESLMEDPTKLFLEAEADWQHLTKWDAVGIDGLVERLQVVGDYLQDNVLAFLRASDDDQEVA